MKGDDIMPGMDGFINFNGTLQGGIEGGGGGDVVDVKVRHSQSTDYESVVNPEKIALIDLISYVRRNELAQELMVLENNFDLELTLKQDRLTAGDNITIENNVISAASSTINYSTDEQLTGQKWIDGKNIYQKTFEKSVNVTTKNRTWYSVISSSELSDISAEKIFIDFNSSYIEDSDGIYGINYSSVLGSTGGVIGATYDKTTNEIKFCIAGFTAGTRTVKLTIKYTKITE